jgi:peptide/nickel transport system permease protein
MPGWIRGFACRDGSYIKGAGAMTVGSLDSAIPDLAEQIEAEVEVGAAAKGFGSDDIKPATFLERASSNRSLVVAVVILVFMVLVAVFAPLVAPYDPYVQDLANRMKPPVFFQGGTWEHILGTDGLGRDYLSRIIYGARISLLVGFMAAIVSCVIGVGLGVSAGYFGGRVDMVITFLLMVRLSLPVLLVVLATVSLVGGSITVVVLALGCLIWDRFAVVARSATQQVRSADYVRAARALGCSQWQLLRTDIVPNILGSIIVVATFEIAHAILLEASLSFLGLGVKPPFPSWGLMIAEAREYLFFQPWLIALPGTALFALCLAINLLGDGLRDLAAGQGRT